MKSITTALLTLGLTCGLAISGFCQNQQHQQQPMSMEPTGFRDAFKGAPNRVSIGLDYHHTNAETHNSVLGDRDGNDWGFALNYDYYRDDYIYFGVSFDWDQGHTDDTVRVDCTEVDAQARFGYTWTLGDSSEFFITPFIGLGYRSMDETWKTSTGDRNMDRSMAYLPVGLRTGWWINHSWDIGLNAQWRWGFFPTSTAFGGPDDTEYTLKSSDGWEFELPITYRFESKHMDGFDLRLVPYYQSSTFGQGKDLALIDKVTYEQWGARLELGYRF